MTIYRILFLLLFSSILLGQPLIAVLDFEPRGEFTQDEISILSDRFRSELVKTKQFKLLDRQERDRLNQELGIQRSREFDRKKAVKAGNRTGAKYLVFGYLGKLGSLYTLDVNFVDLETGEILSSYNQDYRGDIEGLIKIMNSIAKKMAGIEKGNGWKWIAGGTVTVIGIVVYVILNKPVEDSSLPLPPSPPGYK